MKISLKYLFMNFLIHSTLLILIFLVSQNNKYKSSINFLTMKSVEIPIGFIIGLSFISGSAIGGATLFFTKDHIEGKLSS